MDYYKDNKEIHNLNLIIKDTCQPHFNGKLFKEITEKYGNKEFFKEDKLKPYINLTDKPKITGFLSEETAKNYKNWIWENPGKLYIVSYSNKIRYFFPFGLISYYY